MSVSGFYTTGLLHKNSPLQRDYLLLSAAVKIELPLSGISSKLKAGDLKAVDLTSTESYLLSGDS